MNEFSSDDFFSLLHEAALRIGVDIVRVSGEDLIFRHGGKELTGSLANIRPRVEHAPEHDRAAMLEKFLRVLVRAQSLDDAHSANLDELRDKLMPRIGPPMNTRGSGLIVARREFIPDHLEINIVGDEADLMWYVTDNHLAAWQTDFDGLLLAAIENLRLRTSPAMVTRLDDVPGLLCLNANDSYDAARMLVLKDFVGDWPREGVVVGVPTRDLLLVVPLDSAHAIEPLHTLIQATHNIYSTDGYTISDQVFWYDGQHWEPIAVSYAENAVNVIPGEGFIDALNRLSGA